MWRPCKQLCPLSRLQRLSLPRGGGPSSLACRWHRPTQPSQNCSPYTPGAWDSRLWVALKKPRYPFHVDWFNQRSGAKILKCWESNWGQKSFTSEERHHTYQGSLPMTWEKGGPYTEKILTGTLCFAWDRWSYALWHKLTMLIQMLTKQQASVIM